MPTFWKPPTDKERKETGKRVNVSSVRANTEEAMRIFGLSCFVSKLPEDCKEYLEKTSK